MYDPPFLVRRWYIRSATRSWSWYRLALDGGEIHSDPGLSPHTASRGQRRYLGHALARTMFTVRTLRVIGRIHVGGHRQEDAIPTPVCEALLASFGALQGDGGGEAPVVNPCPAAWRVRAASLAVIRMSETCTLNLNCGLGALSPVM